MNVLIGRNNAGKSSVLHAIETGLSHLSSGRIAKLWNTRNRPIDEFTRRDAAQPIQIGLSFHLEREINQALKQKILASGAGLEVAVNQLDSADIVSVICAVILDHGEAVLYVQEVGLASIDATNAHLNISSNRIFSVSHSVARTLAGRERSINRLKADIDSIDRLDVSMLEYSYRETPPGSRSRILRDIGSRIGGSASLSTKIDELRSSNDSIDKFYSALAQLKASYEADIEEVEKSRIEEGVAVFSGTVHGVPDYVGWLLKKLSEGVVLSFKEIRDAIGRDEANQILKLKTKRGGAEALARVQSTVKSLLGVQVDAFEPESPSLSRRGASDVQAEMDVDDFLVEANGAGIREALRIILDLELKGPHLAFIEEPEVHLHPGLERILHSYLVSKSENVQLFVATHSANFLDASARQNVYLVSRLDGQTSDVQKVASEGDLLKISDEVGLRPSTVLMFDRLVFVEGPSDEEVLTELSRKLGLDIAASSTTFVQMGGASRFAHYAAEATLDLLSRRQIKMWFVIDKDERDDSDVTKLLEKLGSRAELTFLGRREIENYLLFPDAVRSLLIEKMSTSRDRQQPSLEEVEAIINQSAQSLLERAIELRLSKTILKPIYAQYGGSSVSERLAAMNTAISTRMEQIEATEAGIRAELTHGWENNASKIAPGSEILDAVFAHYGLRYKKEIDARRLAERIEVAKLDPEITRFLNKVAV
jgi:predicted ATP-dependent endonuclease of OLD family